MPMLSDIATGGGLYVAIGRGTDLTSDILPHITHEMLTILICRFTSKKGELEGRMNNSTRHSYLSEYPYEKNVLIVVKLNALLTKVGVSGDGPQMGNTAKVAHY